jgi:FtsZ-binding cell division protein ZapB
MSEVQERRKALQSELSNIKHTLKELKKDSDDVKRETYRLAIAK